MPPKKERMLIKAWIKTSGQKKSKRRIKIGARLCGKTNMRRHVLPYLAFFALGPVERVVTQHTPTHRNTQLFIHATLRSFKEDWAYQVTTTGRCISNTWRKRKGIKVSIAPVQIPYIDKSFAILLYSEKRWRQNEFIYLCYLSNLWKMAILLKSPVSVLYCTISLYQMPICSPATKNLASRPLWTPSSLSHSWDKLRHPGTLSIG